MSDAHVVRPHEPMAPNETIGNTSPKKRKGEDDGGEEKLVKLPTPSGKKPRQDDVAAPAPAASPSSLIASSSLPSSSTSHNPLIQIKGRKLVLTQEPYKIIPPPRRSLEFASFLLEAQEQGHKVTEIPEQHWGLIAMLGHESTARTENLLVKQIRTALMVPVGGDSETLSSDALSSLISKLFHQNDYGLIASDFSPSSSTTKVPVSLQLKYWEVIDLDKYFSGAQLSALKSRLDQRKSARVECVKSLESMDDVERLELLKGSTEKSEKGPKLGRVEKGKQGRTSNHELEAGEGSKVDETASCPESSPATLPRGMREGTAGTIGSARSARSVSPTKKPKPTPEEAEAVRALKAERQAEKEAKLQAKAEKKAEDERVQQKKEISLARQAQTMASFFSKKPVVQPKAVASPSKPAEATASSSESNPSPSRPVVSDFERTFKPVQKRPNVYWAPINAWHEARESSSKQDAAETSSVQGWSAKDFLKDHLGRHGHSLAPPPRASLPPGLKTAPRFGSVGDVWREHEEAEDPRKVLELLKDRTRFPWKVLAFDDQVRPPYCGTFSKKSVAVGARTPFAQDPALDYSYDSGDEWQDDDGGEDVDDFGEGRAGSGDDEDDEGGEEEDEFDDWLDDSEEVGFARPGDRSISGSPEPLEIGPSGAEQTKLPRQVVKSRQVPKKVVKLTPSWRGPMWESEIGSGFSGMTEYRLQLLNDTPESIDPFTYTSSDPAQAFKTNFSSTVIGTHLSVRCLLSADPITPRPPVPPFDANMSTLQADGQSGPSGSGSGPRGANGPKIAFPDHLLGDLLRLVEGSRKIRTDLISQLRERFEGFATKAAIEAKLKVVAVREGKSKDSPWKVLPEAWVSATQEEAAAKDLASRCFEPKLIRLISDLCRTRRSSHIERRRQDCLDETYQSPDTITIASLRPFFDGWVRCCSP
ncbi:hypothetical protein BD324DRAFT_629227 [Kockovaella imperatae]|uniref:Chromatin assembly factor 1 subunit A-domain-containing protein n=1 Tax=Kockovaella imperatae TaxID=4999 RepID=A0A1Y1UEQ3_9TREE|nr:hypothetical protein BD324DRAFT_629227 [Kockovaella imperatae]ORX36523.1 hypothetical protein BD324DRAFT_629227 [Kockovaella imperatae]